MPYETIQLDLLQFFNEEVAYFLLHLIIPQALNWFNYSLKLEVPTVLYHPQAVSMFSAALQSGQLGPIVQQFDVSNEAVAATTQGNMEEFVRALQNASISGQQTRGRPTPETTQPEKRMKSEDENKDADGDDNMLG